MKPIILSIFIAWCILSAFAAFVSREPSNEELCAASGGKLECSPDGKWQECVHPGLEVKR